MRAFALFKMPLNSIRFGKDSVCKTIFCDDISAPSSVTLFTGEGKSACSLCVENESTVFAGEKIALPSNEYSAPIHSPINGKIVSFNECSVKIKAESSDGVFENGAPSVQDTEEFINAINDSGIIGPDDGISVAYKLKSAVKAHADILIVNAAHNAPYLDSDRYICKNDTAYIINGIRAIKKLLRIKKIMFGIVKGNDDTEDILAESLSKSIQLRTLPDKYPSGDPYTLVYDMTGIKIPKGNSAFDFGILTLDVETVAFIGKYIIDGEPFIKRRVDIVVPDEKKKFFVVAPIGMSYGEIFRKALPKRLAHPEKIVVGNILNGRRVSRDEPLRKTDNVIFVFNNPFKERPDERECIKCGRCVRVCPAELAPCKLYDCVKKQGSDVLKYTNADSCIKCGNCDYVCPASKSLMSEISAQKSIPGPKSDMNFGENTSEFFEKRAFSMLPILIAMTAVFGIKFLLISLLSVACCAVFDLLPVKLMKKDIKNRCYINVATGFLISFFLPQGAPVWSYIVAAAIAVFIGRFLLKSYFAPAVLSSAAVSFICKASFVRNDLTVYAFIVITAGILLSAVIMIYIKQLKLLPMLVFLAVFVGFSLIIGSFSLVSAVSVTVMLIAVYLLSDNPSVPFKTFGKCLFALCCAIIAVLLRKYTAIHSAELIAVIAANIMTPFINHVTVKK